MTDTDTHAATHTHTNDSPEVDSVLSANEKVCVSHSAKLYFNIFNNCVLFRCGVNSVSVFLRFYFN